MKSIFKKKSTTSGRTVRKTYESPSVASFSYSHVRRNTEPTARLERKTKWLWWQKATLLLLGNVTIVTAIIITVMAVLYGGTLASQAKVTLYPTSSMLYRDKAEYVQAVSDRLDHSFFDMFKLTFQKKALVTALTQQFPEIKSISITLPIVGRKPVIDIELYKPSIVLISNDKKYLLDENGSAITVLTTDNTNFMHVTDQSGIPIKIGKPILAAQELGVINDFVAQLNDKHIEVTQITLPAVAKEVHMTINAASYYVKVSLADDPRMQAGDLIATLKELEKSRVVPAEYIDVRVEDRVFYR